MSRLLLLVALALSAACSGRDATWHDETRLLYHGIPVRVAFRPADARLADEVWRGLEAVDDVFNAYRADSEIGRINAGAAPVAGGSADLRAAFAVAQELHGLSGGVFDVAVRPLIDLWNAGTEPDPAALSAARARMVDAWRSEADGALRIRPGAAFDFGGLVKGWAVDRASAVLRDRCDVLVQVGGETCCWGLSPRGGPWRFGVPDPADPTRNVAIITAPPGGLAASTSGNYRAPVLVDGRPVWHVLDPRSGRPARTDVASATVVFPGRGGNALADGLATAGVLLGFTALDRLATARDGAALVLTWGPGGAVMPQRSATWETLAGGAEATP